MTVPVQPGPFSFLAALGQAGGEAVQAAQKEKDKRLKQAQDRLNQMIELRIAGLIPPEAFGSAEAMKLYNTVGITPISTQPTAAETTERLHRTYLAPGHPGRPDIHVPLGLISPGMQDVTIPGQEGTGPYSLTPQQRLAIGRPASAESGEALAGARNQAALSGLSGTPAQREIASGSPSPLTAEATVQAQQNPLLQHTADRVVGDLYSRLGRVPTADEAMAAAQGDIRAKPFADQLNQSFYGEAITNLNMTLYNELTKRIQAENAGGLGRSIADITAIQDMQRQLNDQITTLKNDSAEKYNRLGPLAKSQLGDPKDYSAVEKEALGAIAHNDSLIAKNRLILDNLNRLGGQAVINRTGKAQVGTPTPGAAPGPLYHPKDRAEWDVLEKAIKANPNDPRVAGKTPEQLMGPRPEK